VRHIVRASTAGGCIAIRDLTVDTPARAGITGARACCVTDLDHLLSRDHAELDRSIRTLMSSEVMDDVWWNALDAARLGFGAHAGATERLVNDVLASSPTLRGPLLDQVLVAHRAQELVLARLIRTRSHGQMTADARDLRMLLLSHDEHDRLLLLPALRRALSAEEYAALAGRYATERVAALGQLRTLAVGMNPRRAVAIQS
jgi:hypothetical protein